MRINENQYKQCDIMTKKRVNTTYQNKAIRKLLSSDLDLFVSSFDQTIDDTFSREFFLEEVVKTLNETKFSYIHHFFYSYIFHRI